MDGSARGKLILVGEHAVVHAHAAVAAALDRGARATAAPGPPVLHLRLGASADAACVSPDDGSELGRAFAALLAAAGPPNRARVDAWIDVPTRAGLGSSAALAVAIARALGVAEDRVAEVALAAERVFHGAPSGIDTAAAQHGGVGIFSRATGWQPIDAKPLQLCVGLDGLARKTRESVARVTERLAASPTLTGAILADLGALAPAAVGALQAGDARELGRVLDAAHGLLQRLEVSSAALDALCAIARSAGATGAKLTGAGGGGAVIAVVEGDAAAVLDAWRRSGASGFRVKIPCTR
jgi:mevalonate kinase